MKEEIMYNQNSILISALLFIAILIAYEIFFHIGRLYQNKTDYEVKSQTTAIQAGILGLLALLLGFTFNMALQRFDNRSHAVINEANTIGTALLRTRLLPEPYNSTIYSLLQKYIDLRIEISSVDLTMKNQRKSINDKTDEIQNQIWDQVIKAAEIDPRPVTTGYFIASLNDLIDARGERNALLQRHVPEVILFLLFSVFIISGALMGYTSGLGLKRAYIPTVIFSLLLVLVVFIIIDLDRPKRGLITVKQDSLIELKSINP
jgi:ribose/xylose/arabinose/galactoside ABC-type transport system permease subunit